MLFCCRSSWSCRRWRYRVKSDNFPGFCFMCLRSRFLSCLYVMTSTKQKCGHLMQMTTTLIISSKATEAITVTGIMYRWAVASAAEHTKLMLLNSTQLNRELRTQVSSTSKSASLIYTIHKQTISLYDFFRSVSGPRQIGCKIKFNYLLLPKLI